MRWQADRRAISVLMGPGIDVGSMAG